MTHNAQWTLALVVLALVAADTLTAQLADTCAPNSPERRGAVGCTIVETKALPDGLREPLFWHIDRFASLERARSAVGPASVAFDAASASWLMTIESQTSDHHGGEHVTQVGPLQLPSATKYAMQAFSVAWTPGLYSLVHHHSGVEAFYVIDGEQCLQTPTEASRMGPGDTAALPAGVVMRVMATGTTMRRALAVLVHDAAQPPTMRMDEGKAPQLASCK
jgi:quercetin dioxygenase-like cupin family protein